MSVLNVPIDDRACTLSIDRQPNTFVRFTLYKATSEPSSFRAIPARNAEPSFHCEMRVSFCRPFSARWDMTPAPAASSFDRRTSFKKRQARDSPSFRM
jgi:hypothetical protein